MPFSKHQFSTMNQLYNSYNAGSATGPNDAMTVIYGNRKKSFAAPAPDSLFSMALYEFEAAQQAHQQDAAASALPVLPKTPGHFYPVDEYKDMSLRDILDISDDFLFDDLESAYPASQQTRVPRAAPVMRIQPPVTSSANPVNPVSPQSSYKSAQPIHFPTPDVSLSAMDLSPKKKRTRDDLEEEELSFHDDEELDEHGRRFRPYQAGQWSEKFVELCAYKDSMGHCLVPHTFSENLPLARWVKRQRYQYKLMRENKSSTMTEERVHALEDIGFIWDSQGAAWGERLAELRLYRVDFGHANVPSNFSQNPQLATWVKCQRRQYKLHLEGKASNMTPQRVRELENLGFEWELRSYKKARN
jgi:hypothetical protein